MLWASAHRTKSVKGKSYSDRVALCSMSRHSHSKERFPKWRLLGRVLVLGALRQGSSAKGDDSQGDLKSDSCSASKPRMFMPAY